MPAMKRLLLLALALPMAAGCKAKTDPRIEDAWRAYEKFAEALFKKQFSETRAMTAGSTSWGWAPKAEKEASEERGSFSSIALDRKKETLSGTSVVFRAYATVNYSGGPSGPVKKRYKHDVTMTEMSGAWKVTHLEVTVLE